MGALGITHSKGTGVQPRVCDSELFGLQVIQSGGKGYPAGVMINLNSLPAGGTEKKKKKKKKKTPDRRTASSSVRIKRTARSSFGCGTWCVVVHRKWPGGKEQNHA